MSQTQDPSRVVNALIDSLGTNAGYVIDVYDLYRQSPQTVNAAWRGYFEGLERGEISPHELPVDASPREDGAAPAPAPDNGADGAASSPESPSPAREAETAEPLRGSAALIVRNMEASREIPTATSYRSIAVKALEENRRFLNHHLDLASGGKISYTHVIAWAVIRALVEHPNLNGGFAMVQGEPHRLRRPRIHLGVAVDLEKKDGTRTLLVPNLKDVQSLDFRRFLESYNRIIENARSGKLLPEDFLGTTVSITNPGTVGTASSVPRLMPGQGAIIAVGAIGYSAATRAMSREILSRLGISKSMTVSCTYDHRIIQGAESGEFLGRVERLLQGEEGFYDRLYEDMGVPYHPVRWTPDAGAAGLGGSTDVDEITRQARVLQLINAYRVRGHLIAQLDPLGTQPQYHPELDPEYYGLTLWDLDRTFITGAASGEESAWNRPQSTLREILETVRGAYCGKIGIEYMNIQDPEQKAWVQDHVEPAREREPLDPGAKKRILAMLVSAEAFERFLHAKFIGHKRFSLEGGETLIPVLDMLLEAAVADGLEEVAMGMAHRGRLNVLTQIVQVDYADLFCEFQGTRDPNVTQGSGDVKYHLGATGVHTTRDGREVRITLSPNPSHLEAVNPVVEGIARAKQERMGAEEGRRRILPILIHGDAAFAGQGIVAETLNLSQLKGYRTGGTVHIIVNNQIGFTTPVESARSSPYPTDVAKMGQAPIFHVNGDDPEAAVRVVRWALAFRQAFQKDVVIDMVCYRRHGHNEGDEPSYTQPRLYARIQKHPSVATLYAEKLLRDGTVTEEEFRAFKAGSARCLDLSFERAQHEATAMKPAPIEVPTPRPGAAPVPRATATARETLERITEAITSTPPDVDVHPKLRKGMAERRRVMETGEGVDWAFAETLAFGSLVLEKTPVRLSGQDSVRGTFSQRHLLLVDDDTDASWMALQHLAPDQAPMNAIDSPLSEQAVMGFEFGYSLGDPTALVLWEAQFGDFVNGAQTLIDQFIAGSKAKWGQPSGLVLLLPHGYEGQGPDHSSARPERFLQLAAEDNLQIVNASTPAQYFHVLRRQMCEGIRTPLVVFTPKSLLRHPRARSAVRELTEGRFHRVLADPTDPDPREVKRLLLCTGKVYYDLVEAREKAGRTDVAVYRVEQMYPFPEAEIREALSVHRGATAFWVQEEPRNMGGWHFMHDRLATLRGQEVGLGYVGRKESASTATGYHDVHAREQKALVAEALGR